MAIESWDFLTIISSLVGFISFFILHLTLLRGIRRRKIITQVKKTYFLSVWTVFIPILLFKYQTGCFSTKSLVFASTEALFLYSLLCLFFVLAFLGMLQSSVRINLLMHIYSGKNGMRKEELKKSLETEVIVKDRLDRLVESGDIKYVDGKYQLNRKLSYFYFHAFMFEFLKRIMGSRRK